MVKDLSLTSIFLGISRKKLAHAIFRRTIELNILSSLFMAIQLTFESKMAAVWWVNSWIKALIDILGF